MNIIIKKIKYEAIKDKLHLNINSHISYFDSFLENHILNSEHYEILFESKQIGYFSIFENSLLTQFYLDNEYVSIAQEIFDRIRKYENVQKAFVTTSDEFFLSHAFDYSKKIEPQAYFFKDSGAEISRDKILNDFNCRLAVIEDYEFIKNKSGDFFDDPINSIENKQIYIGYLNDIPVSFGIIEQSQLYNNMASIRMFTISDNRLSGIGRNTLLKLKEICYQNGIIPIAGCWYYNHNSKKTLESAGMVSQTRLLVLSF